MMGMEKILLACFIIFFILFMSRYFINHTKLTGDKDKYGKTAEVVVLEKKIDSSKDEDNHIVVFEIDGEKVELIATKDKYEFIEVGKKGRIRYKRGYLFGFEYK